jgi:hypothetical protein
MRSSAAEITIVSHATQLPRHLQCARSATDMASPLEEIINIGIYAALVTILLFQNDLISSVVNCFKVEATF